MRNINGADTISDEEYQKVGFDECARYCKEYCWRHGYGHCDICAYDKDLRNTNEGIEVTQ